MEREQLASYVPSLLRAHLATAGGCVSRELEPRHAAALLTDMQGFTGLVETAVAGGRASLDRFDAQINPYFSRLIDAVHAHGGDILAFAGDSMLCIWPAASAEDLAAAAARACRAALQIQAALATAAPTRIGIGAGALRCVLAGGHAGRWELLAAGPALSHAIEAEQQGRPGSVILHAEALAALGGRARTQRLASGGHRLLSLAAAPAAPPAVAVSGPTLPDAALEPLVPAAVMHRVRTGQWQWLAEVRPTTVVVAGLHGLDWLQPESLELAHRGVLRFQQLLDRYGGTPRLSMDDKGLLVVGDFGLPPAPPERHAERAVRAAQDLLQALRELGVTGSVGVSTARALCTSFGDDRRREFAVFGEGTVLATRLMQEGRDEVLCDAATAQAAREGLRFSLPEMRPVKGRQQPVRVCRPLGRRDDGGDGGDRAALVGRRRECDELAQRLAQLADGRGGMLLIQGEAGLGKSMLLAEARRLARADGLRCLAGGADVVDRRTPYQAWTPVFTHLLELPDDIEGEQVIAHVVSRFPAAERMAGLLPLIGPVLGLSIADTAQTRDLRGEVRATNTHRVMRRMLRHFSDHQPLLITIEDAHWLDSASLAFMGWLAHRPERWLLLVTSRPHDLGHWPQALRRAADARMRLGEMSDADLHQLACESLGVGELPRVLAQLLVRKVGGNPFFCRELVRALADAGRLRVRDGRCEVQSLPDEDLPATVESAVLGRVDRLGPPEQLCLKTAAILGQSFREDTLRGIHPQPSERPLVASRLASAGASELVSRERPGPGAAWTFRHAIVRDVTYGLWTREQRAPLHRAVAQWYEARFADDLPPLYPLLAHHWDEAGDAVTALRYTERAAEQALRAGAYDEARRLYSRALTLPSAPGAAAGDGQRARWHCGLGMAQYYLGELAASRRHLEIAVGLLHRALPTTLAAARIGLLPALLLQVQHRLRPGRTAGRLRHRQEQIELAVDCCSKLGQIYYLDGEPAERLLAVTLVGLNLAEQGDDGPALARILAGSAILASLAGLNRLAQTYARRARTVAQTDAGREAAPFVWHYEAILQAQQGRWQSARLANDRALAMIRQRGDQTLEAEASVVRSTFLLCQDDFAGAESAWSRALRLARRVGNAQIECWCLLDAAETHLERLELGEAEQCLDQALRIATPAHDGYSNIEKQRMLARVRRVQLRLEEAHAACAVVYAMIEAQPPAGYHWADFHATTVEVSLDLIEHGGAYATRHRRRLHQEARAGCRRLHRLARRFGNVRLRAQILQARLDWIEGRRADAEQRWRACTQQALAEDLPNEAARAVAELRRHDLPVEGLPLLGLRAVLLERQARRLLQATGLDRAPSPAAVVTSCAVS